MEKPEWTFLRIQYIKKKKNDNQMQRAILDWTRKGIFFSHYKDHLLGQLVKFKWGPRD